MKTYQVKTKIVLVYNIEVNASSKEDAELKAFELSDSSSPTDTIWHDSEAVEVAAHETEPTE